MTPKSTFKIILMALLISTFACANSHAVNNLFDKANQAYANKNYEQAIASYRQILQKGYVSGKLYYNLGNAYYRKGQVGHAILNYERAQKYMPDNENVQFNLKLARLKIKDKVNRPPEFIIFRVARDLMNSLSALHWAMVLSASILLMALSFAVFSLASAEGLQSFAKKSMILFLICSLLSSYPLYYKYNLENKGNRGIILANAIKANSAPQEGSTTLFIIHEGTKVKVLGQDTKWYKIELLDGKQGWVPSEAIGII